MITFEQLFFETPLIKRNYLVNVPDDRYALHTMRIEVIEPQDTPEDRLRTIAKRRFLQHKYQSLHGKKNLGDKHKQQFFQTHYKKCVIKPVK